MAGQIELQYGPVFSTLTRQFISEKSSLILEAGNSTRYVVNSVRRAGFLREKYLLSAPSARTSDYPFLPTFAFLNEFYRKLNIPAARLTFEQRLLFLQSIVESLWGELHHREDSTQPLSQNVLKTILTFFDEIRLQKAEDQLVEKTLSLDLTREGVFHDDLIRIYAEYKKPFSEDFADEARILHHIIREISSEWLQHNFPGLKTIVWENVSGFKPLHLDLIKQFQATNLDQFILITYGNNPEIFENKRAVFKKIQNLAKRMRMHNDTGKVSQALFQLKPSGLDIAERISIAAATDRLREVETLAGEIKKLVLDRDIRFAQIAVSGPTISAYRSILEAVLQRYRIPYIVREQKLLREALPVQSFVLLLDLVENNYLLEDIKKILQSPYFNYGDTLADTEYRQILNRLRVSAEKDEIIRQVENAISLHAEAGQQNSETLYERQHFQKLLDVLKDLFKDVSFVEKSHTAPEYYQFLIAFIEKHRLSLRIMEDSETGENADAPENLAALRVMLEQLFFWQKHTAATIDEKFNVRQFKRLFLLLINSEKFSVRQPQDYGVQIVPFYELLDVEYKYNFVLGMEDGAFPANNPDDISGRNILPQQFRHFLPSDQLFREREFFLQMVGSPHRHWQFSYPQFQGENPVLPSIFLRELQRISGQSLAAERAVKLYSAADLLQALSPRFASLEEAEQTISRLPSPFNKLISESLRKQLYYRINVEKERSDSNSFSQWDGNLSEIPQCREWLDAHFKQARFSVSQLERYATCPMIFFFENILHTAVPEDLDEFLTPLDRGLVIHNILFRFYHEKDAGKRIFERLHEIAEMELDKIPLPDTILWRLEKEYYLGSNRHQGLFRSFWEKEKEYLGQYFTEPKHFELSFGLEQGRMENVDDASAPKPFEFSRNNSTFYLRGKIDRIEISPAGDLLIVDYKSGNYPRLNDMWEGGSLQLPIYLKVAHHLLNGDTLNLQPAGGAYYLLKNEKEIEKRVMFASQYASLGEEVRISKISRFPNDAFLIDENPASFEQFIERIFDFAAQYILNIRQGFFPHTLENRNCQSYHRVCEYMPLCRLQGAKQAFLKQNAEKV